MCFVAQMCLTLCNPMDYSAPGSSASLSELRELVMDREACHAAVHEVPKSWTCRMTDLKIDLEGSRNASQIVPDLSPTPFS